MSTVLEVFSFYEIFDLFLVLWNHHPGYDLDTTNLGAVKRDVADIMSSLSKCSLGSLSKMSLGSWSDSDETNELAELKNIVKFSGKEEKKVFDQTSPVVCMSKGEPFDGERMAQLPFLNNFSPRFEGTKLMGGDELPTTDSSETTNENMSNLKESCVEFSPEEYRL